MLRQGEAELVTQIGQTPGTLWFDQAFSAGTRLRQRAAVAAVRDRSGTRTADNPATTTEAGSITGRTGADDLCAAARSVVSAVSRTDSAFRIQVTRLLTARSVFRKLVSCREIFAVRCDFRMVMIVNGDRS
jgi:hypothetical protein